jgi:hypothetical protein
MAVHVEQGPSEPATEPTRLGPRWLGLLPGLAFLATFGVFFIDKNREARTVFESGRGLLTVAVIVVGYLGIAFGVRRLVRWTWVPPLALSAVVIALAAWIVRPYYVDEIANREVVSGPVRDTAGSEPSTGTGEPSPDERPSEEAVRISTGELQGIDHDAGGSVSLLRAEDGALVVRFERFQIEGTPDPQVYLVDASDARDPGGVGLGRLPGNRGDVLDIEVPGEAEAGGGWTVLVWCGSFSVPIANATQTAT